MIKDILLIIKNFSELNWSPLVSFKDGLKNTINWYIDNIKP